MLTSCSAQTNNLSSSSNMGVNDGVIFNLNSSRCEDVFVAIFRQNGTSFIQFFGNSANVLDAPEYCDETIDLTLRETIIEVVLKYSANSSGIKYVFDRNGYYFLIEIDDRS